MLDAIDVAFLRKVIRPRRACPASITWLVDDIVRSQEAEDTSYGTCQQILQRSLASLICTQKQWVGLRRQSQLLCSIHFARRV